MAKEKLTQSEIDGVDYRRAKLWQIILVAFNAFNGMAVYFLIGLASYSASIGYGIATLVVGGLLTFTRIFDAITDPLLAFVYDRFNTPFGKVRPLLFIGWLIQSIGLLCLFNLFSSKGHGIPVFLASSTCGSSQYLASWPSQSTWMCIRSSSLEYILNVYSLSRLKTGLIITCYLGANLQKVSQIMGVSKENIQNNGLKSKIGTYEIEVYSGDY